MSASSFMLGHRYGFRTAFGSASQAGSPLSAANQFAGRARTLTRLTCPSCSVGSPVEEQDPYGTPTGGTKVVAAVPVSDVLMIRQLIGMADALSAQAGVSVSCDSSVSTVLRGAPVRLLSFTFS